MRRLEEEPKKSIYSCSFFPLKPDKISMEKGNSLFIIFCLVLTMGLMESYYLFQEHFSPVHENQRQISKLKKQVELKKLEVAELEARIYDFQQQVALQLPALQQIEKSPKTLPLRSLASVTQKPLEGFELSGILNERAQIEFRKKDFKSSAQTFRSLIQKYPTSPLVIQAYFFLAESLFLSGQQQECLDIIDQMISLYPDQELTGFIMLRMGQVLQVRNRSEEAGEVYRTVMQAFASNLELRNQAQKLMQSVD
jgi:TolA-binding protein